MLAKITFLILLPLTGAACHPQTPAVVSPDRSSRDVSAEERQLLLAVRAIHEPGLGLIQRLRQSGLLADNAEWWVAGPPDVLPFAGTWHALEGIAEFQRRLSATVRYDTVAVREYLVSGEQVAAIFFGAGVGRATGRRFSGEIVRLYTFENGRIVRVRNYYDTGSYVRAVTAQNAAEAWSLMLRADSLAAARRYADAAIKYAAALSVQSDSLRWARRTLGTFWRAGRYEDAYSWGLRVQAVEPDARDVLFNLAVTCGFLVQIECLETNLNRLVTLYPGYAIAHGELGFLAQARGDMPEAIRHMERAHALAPDDDFAVSGLAQMLIPAGRAAAALPLLEARLQLKREAPAYGGRSMLTLYGWALIETGDTARAYAAFDEVLVRLAARERAGEDSYQLFRERAAIHALRGEYPEAIAALETSFGHGFRLYGSWNLVDPMFNSVKENPAVAALIRKMRSDVRAQRARLGLTNVNAL